MKKYLIYITIIFTLFFIPYKVNVKAVCDNRTIVDFRELLKNVKIYSDYRMVDGRAMFDVTITNIPYNVYLEDVDRKIIYKYENFTTQNELIIKDYYENQKINYRFYIDTPGCYGEVLGSRTITLPNYNERMTDPLCEGIEEFNLCQKWIVTDVPYSEFEKKTNEYRVQKGLQKPAEETNGEQEDVKNKLISFIVEYYIFLVAAVAIIVLLLIALKNRAEEKSEFDFKV